MEIMENNKVAAIISDLLMGRKLPRFSACVKLRSNCACDRGVGRIEFSA